MDKTTTRRGRIEEKPSGLKATLVTFAASNLALPSLITSLTASSSSASSRGRTGSTSRSSAADLQTAVSNLYVPAVDRKGETG
jgi:hypothetical protein